MTTRVAVAIPFFQREPGLLLRAVRSVLAQTGPVSPWIVVVDDSSPIPAEAELADLDAAARTKIDIRHRPNGGCGNARNTAFDALPGDIEFVALLDADDAWKDDHLRRALEVFELGYDFYFSDACWENDPAGVLAGVGMDPAEHTPIGPDLHAVAGDFFDRCLRRAPVPVSTAVWRRTRLGHLRFARDLRPLCEDLLFWLDVARATDRIAYGARIGAVYGYGVSLSRSDDWASAKALANAGAYAQYFREVRRRFPLTPDQARFVDAKIRQGRMDFAITVAGMIRRGRAPDPRLIARFLARDPWAVAALPAALASRLVRRGESRG